MLSHSTAGCSEQSFDGVRPPVPEFMVFGGMMVGKADISRLIGRFARWKFYLFSETIRAIPQRQNEIRAVLA